jgi:hypothetical protein
MTEILKLSKCYTLRFRMGKQDLERLWFDFLDFDVRGIAIYKIRI